MGGKARRDYHLEARGVARPVPGRVVRGNYFGPLRYAGLGLSLVIMALSMLYYLSDSNDPRVDFLRARPYVALLYGSLLVLGSVLVISLVLVRNRRMIIGEDRLQLVEGFGRVLGQLPYDNIIEVTMSPTMGLEIILDRLSRRDTWWPGLENLEDGTVMIGSGLEADATAIRLYVRTALREFRMRHESTD